MTAAPLPSPTLAADAPGAEQLVIPVLREEAQVKTEREHIGTVRLTKRVHHTSLPVETTGYREYIETYRVPVGEVVDRVEAPWQQDGATVIPVYEERLVRQLVLVEEVHVVRRRAYDDGAKVDLRKEELLIDRLDHGSGQWVADPGGRPGS